MLGMGDCIYQRPLVRTLNRLFKGIDLVTPWPQFFHDLGVKLYPYHCGIRTCQANENRSQHYYADTRTPRSLLGLRYDGIHLQGTYGGPKLTVFQSMEKLCGARMGAIAMDLPDFGPSPIEGDYILVRPVTQRTDWISFSRNPQPEYVAQAAAMARRDGYKLVMVAALTDGVEWLLDPVPEVDVSYMHGELTAETLMRIVAGARGIISPVGWAVPASLAYDVPLLCVVGGQLGNNDPKVLTDPRLVSNRITWATPDRPCYCGNVTHECDREISDLAGFYARFAASIESDK